MEDETRRQEEQEAGTRGGVAHAYAPSYIAERETMMLGRVRWGAVWAGFVLAFGVQLILESLVVAILMTAGRGVVNTTALGILTIVVTIVALFAGGWAASRLARLGTNAGIWHAVWLWGLFVTIGSAVIAFGATNVLSATFGTTAATGATRTATVAASWWYFITIVAALVGTLFGGLVGGAGSEADIEEHRSS